MQLLASLSNELQTKTLDIIKSQSNKEMYGNQVTEPNSRI